MVGTHSEFPSTDFAITSVNVPDRLDQREVDDRKLQDEASFYARRRWRSALRIWSRRLLPYLMLLIDGWETVAAQWDSVEYGRSNEVLQGLLREGAAVACASR